MPATRAQVGPPASYVQLPDFAAETSSIGWAANGPVPVTAGATWDAETVADSVRAARNETTRDAWRQVRDLVSDDLRSVIDGALE
ncbi:hypothetical protein GCM10009727_95980 [Actinomadura napierensis]|uniref:Uncharacterized protein n=1 Tax=Actinomadura napierensis TaxID=267854 RepID=A0ABP5M9L6_9ACTN